MQSAMHAFAVIACLFTLMACGRGQQESAAGSSDSRSVAESLDAQSGVPDGTVPLQVGTRTIYVLQRENDAVVIYEDLGDGQMSAVAGPLSDMIAAYPDFDFSTLAAEKP